VIQPQRELKVIDQTDVLWWAAVRPECRSHRRRSERLKVTLVVRYGHFGGLWSGGAWCLSSSGHTRHRLAMQVLPGNRRGNDEAAR
jgi:hypothetical protein